MKMKSYSIAIRTLGLTGDIFRKELESIARQTVQPEKVIVYIAEGYVVPDYRVGKEEYVSMKKGMVAQRALRYDDMSCDYVMLLDDDVVLEPDSMERMLRMAKENGADCLGADTFCNQEMSFRGKVYNILVNLVYPWVYKDWAFKIHHTGSFSYNNYPQHGKFYFSQYSTGPATLWKREVLQKMHLEDELWLDKLGFAYNDDMLETYKVYRNGYKLGVAYGMGIRHLNAKSASGVFHEAVDCYYVRCKASAMIWKRAIYDSSDSVGERMYSIIAFMFKAVWLFFVNIAAGIVLRNIRIPYLYIKGLVDAWKEVHSKEWKTLPNYRVIE